MIVLDLPMRGPAFTGGPDQCNKGAADGHTSTDRQQSPETAASDRDRQK